MPEVIVTGWRTGLQKISMTHVLQERLPLSLAEAKKCVDDVLDGKAVSFAVEELPKARALGQALENVGAVIEIRE
jgi:ribosomal protein L7/L12